MSDKEINPPQSQDSRPGHESEMTPAPVYIRPDYRAAGKLEGKVALITGGDSGIGRAVAVHFAHEGADVAFIYLNEHEDADETVRLVEAAGRRAMKIYGDVGQEEFCQQAVSQVVGELGRLDVLVNNAAEQHPQDDVTDISEEQLERTFRTNIFGYFHMVKSALPHLSEGSTIINTTSVTNYKGSPQLLDYASTKGAIVAFTRSLSMSLAERQIRVNGVAPGPIWTPLIVSTMKPDEPEQFGSSTPLGRPGQPAELAPAYVLLASDEASYISGAMLPVTGGMPVL